MENGFKIDFHKKYNFDSNAILRAINNKTIYKDSYWSTNITININEFECEFKYKYNDKLYKTLQELSTELNLKQCTLSNARKENRKIKGYYIEDYKR